MKDNTDIYSMLRTISVQLLILTFVICFWGAMIWSAINRLG